jgi:hypothetical protein
MMSDYDFIEQNRRVVEEFRANGVKVQCGTPVILLTIKGAKSGQPRIYPLVSVPSGDNYLAIASKGGAPKNPEVVYVSPVQQSGLPRRRFRATGCRSRYAQRGVVR